MSMTVSSSVVWRNVRQKLTRNPLVPAAMSAVLPGLGQALRGRYRKGLLIAAAAALAAVLPSPVGPLVQIGVWAYAVVDAYEG